jgi:excisionase family DNA binding protein
MALDVCSVREAANRLGVDRSRVQALISAGELRAEKVAGSWLIPMSELERRARSENAGGRPWSQHRAWAFLRAVEKGEVSPRDLRRHAWQLRRRARRVELDVLPELESQLLDDERVLVGGVQAGSRFGAAVRPQFPADLYVAERDLDAVIAAHHLLAADVPRVVLHVVDDSEGAASAQESGAVPLAAAWLDMFEAGDRSAREVEHELERRVR